MIRHCLPHAADVLIIFARRCQLHATPLMLRHDAAAADATLRHAMLRRCFTLPFRCFLDAIMVPLLLISAVCRRHCR